MGVVILGSCLVWFGVGSVWICGLVDVILHVGFVCHEMLM